MYESASITIELYNQLVIITDMDTLELNPKSNDMNDGQNGTLQKNESAKTAKEIVMGYFEAAARRDFKSARSYLKDDISYVSPLNSFNRAEPYLQYNFGLHMPKPDIKKIFTDGDDVCFFQELNDFPKPPVTVFAAVWCHVDGGKISSIRVLFDPRPFVQSGR